MFLSFGSTPCVFVHPTIDAWADMRRETATLKSAEQVHASNTLSCCFCHLCGARRCCRSEHVRSECTMWEDYMMYNTESSTGEVHHVGSSLTVLFGSGGAQEENNPDDVSWGMRLNVFLGVWFKRWEREEGREDVIKCCMMGNVGNVGKISVTSPPPPVLL